MEPSSRTFVEDVPSLSPVMFAGAASGKIVKKVSKQLARPMVAGFQARLDREDFNALLKNVSNEKIDVLLDEFMVQYGGRRASLIEEMHSEDQVPLRELFYGEPGLMFGLIGEASAGKTSLLLHMQWRLNCRHDKVLRELKTWDTTWAYFQVPDSEDSSPPIITAGAPLPHHAASSLSSTSNVSSVLGGVSSSGPSTISSSNPSPSALGTSNALGTGNVSGTNSAVTGDDIGALRGLGMSSFNPSMDPPVCPTRFLGIYAFGSELVRRDVGPQGAFELSTVLEASYSTYLLRLPTGKVPVEHSEYIQAYQTLILESESIGVVLLVDGFDFVEQSQRAPLLSSLARTLQQFPNTFFRVFFGSRPNGLFKLEELPDSIIFLCLDRLFSVDWKEKLLARIAPDVSARLSTMPRDSVDARIHRRLIRSCHSPLLVFLLAQLHRQQTVANGELTACLYDLFENFFNLAVRQAKLVRGEPTDVPKTFKVGSMELSEKDFYNLVDVVVFFYHCWIPETSRADWSTRERFEHLMFYLFKYQHTIIQPTILGRLRDHFIANRSPTANNPSPTSSSTLVAKSTIERSASSSSSSGESPSPPPPTNTSGATSNMIPSASSSQITPTSTPSSKSSVNDKAYVELANAIWNSAAEWLVTIGLAHRLMSSWRRNRSSTATNQANIVAILQSPNLGQGQGQQGTNTENPASNADGATPSVATSLTSSAVNQGGVHTPTSAGANLTPLPTSGTSTPSSGFCFEILLKDEQQVQFQIARFLINTDLSGPILDAIQNARTSMRGFETHYPSIFSWQNSSSMATNKHWNYIYDMMASKKGAVWIAKTLLPPGKSINEWLAQMRLSKGVDKDDLGQIRFYRLLRGFALQQEDRDLCNARKKAQIAASESSTLSTDSATSAALASSSSTLASSSGASDHGASEQGDAVPSGRTSLEPPVLSSSPGVIQISGPTSAVNSKSTPRSAPLPKTAEEVEIADLKEAFGMTFVSILEDNPSAIIHIEKAPVSSLACFSQNAISIILDKMVLLLKQGNIFVVADLLINLDRHGLINQDIVNKVVAVVTSSKDYKPIRPALRFLTSRTPSHRHLSAIVTCLAAKDQDAQNEAMDAIATVAQTAVEQARESFHSSFEACTSVPASPSVTREVSDSEEATGGSLPDRPTVPNTIAFGPFDADRDELLRRGSMSKLPADMVITAGTVPKKPVEELYLLEEAHSPDTEIVARSTADSASSQAKSSSNRSLPTVTSSMAPNVGSVNGDAALAAQFNLAASKAKRVPFLYDEQEWSILLRSAISLLVDFVGLDLHKTSKNSIYFNNVFEPRVRLIQCKHLASLVEMMESDDPGTRLLPFILLGTTIRSNNYDRENERLQLEAQLCILEAIGKLYTSHRRTSTTDGGVEHDLIEEMAKQSPSNRGLGYVIHDLLGLQAAKYAVMLEGLIKSKPDLLCSLNSWAFARLPAELRRVIFVPLSLHENLLVQQSILELVTNNRSLIEVMDPTDLTTVIASNFGNPQNTSVSLKRAALRFLELSALTTHSQDYRLHAIDKIIFLLSKFGFNDPVVTEPLLRILDTILSTPTGVHGSGSASLLVSSTFQTPSPFPDPPTAPVLTPQEHKELFNLLSRNNLRQKLIQAFEAQSAKRFWTGKVRTAYLLRHFISPDSEDALEYVHFLKSEIPEIRAIALSELQRIDASLVPALLQRLKELISYEEPLVRTTYSLVIGGLGLRPELQSMAIDVACYQMGQELYPDIQQHGVSILAIMGERVSESVLVSERFEAILNQKAVVLSNSNQKLTIEETGLLMALVECITNVRMTAMSVLSPMMTILRDAGDPAVRTAICLAFKRLSDSLMPDQKLQCAEMATALLPQREGYVREIGIKLIRFFGRDCIKHCAARLIKLISDPELYVRKQAIKAVTCLLHKGDEQAKKEALLLLPAVSNALEDKSPLVIVQALKFLVLLKARNRSVSTTIARLSARAAREAQQLAGGGGNASFDPEDEAQISIDKEGVPVISSMPQHHSFSLPALSSTSKALSSLLGGGSGSASGRHSSDGSSSAAGERSGSGSSAGGGASGSNTGGNSGSSGGSGGSGGGANSSSSDWEDDDPWYVRKVIIPNLDRISALLYRKRYRFNLAIKIGVLNCLGTTRLLQPHLGSFTEMLNSENVPTLVEFSDTMRRLGPGMLQYIPAIVNAIKPGSPLVRNMVRLLARYEKLMDARTCSRLFSLQTILSMMKSKDANVRKVAVSLMGKKVLEKSKHIWVIIQMWGDKNNKVRKEVMEVLGDIGKTKPEYIGHIMNLIDTDSVSSVLVWRFLSKSWGTLIRSVPMSPEDA